MIAELGIYENCESEKPTKVYTCRRLLYGVSKKALALAQKCENKSAEEQEAVMVEMLQAVFPEFQPAELEFIDPAELVALISALQIHSQNEVGRVEKN